MPLKQNCILPHSFCTVLTGLSIFITAQLFAQVPVPHSENLASLECVFPVGSPVVKVMPHESAIPFGISSGSRNATVLDMRGNDQEFGRRFTFKNTSSRSYTINSVDFGKEDRYFEFLSFESGESFPIEIRPGQSFTVRIAFHAQERNVLCSNTLNFNTEGSNLPIAFTIEAIQVPLSSLPWNAKQAVAQAR